jgi:uncharacterized membrane protein YbhN (UPF0104 family)
MHASGTLLWSALHTIASVSPWLLSAAIALHLLKIAAEARAWHGIVLHAHDDPPVGFRTTLGAFVGSISANAILPGGVGEAFRVGVVRRRIPGSSVPTIAATIVLETLLELIFAATVIAVVLIGGRSIGHVGLPGGEGGRDPVLFSGLALLSAAVGVVAIRFRRRTVALVRTMARGFAIMRVPRAFAQVFSWKVAAWILRIATVYVFLLAFDLPATLWMALVVIAAQNVAAAVPFSPGNAGLQQAAFAVVLTGTASAATVLGFGIGMQAATVLADLSVGAAAVALVAGGADVRAALSTLRRRPTPGDGPARA